MIHSKLVYCLAILYLYSSLSIFVLASNKYEQISDWKSGWISGPVCDGCTYINYTCGTNDKNSIAVSSSTWIVQRIGYINFNKCRFPAIELNFVGLFKNLHTFNISDVELETLKKETFWNATKLKNFYASNNRLTEIPSLAFINTQISYIDFSNNSINRIDPMAFEGVRNLQSLNLSHNRIDHLVGCSVLTSLTILDLSSNNLTSLNVDVFEKMTELKHLDISSNLIGNLEVGIFSHSTNLEYLYLRRMNISSIRLGTFSHQHKLISLDLSGNQLKEFNFNLFLPILRYLNSLYLGQNLLEDLIGFRNTLLPQLTVLDIKNNNFNCSHLQRFMESVNWEKLILLLDPKSTNSQEPHIRGINCEQTLDEISNDSPNQNDFEGSENIFITSEIFVIKLILILIFIAISVYVIVFLLTNRDRLFRSEHRHDVNMHNLTPNRVVEYFNDEHLLE